MPSPDARSGKGCPSLLPPVADMLIGRSPQMLAVYKQIGRVAAQDVAVLICGESGTGKELVAKAIYQHSNRSGGPFLAVNCAALPDMLLESELFGHEKGAFTGADAATWASSSSATAARSSSTKSAICRLRRRARCSACYRSNAFERVGGPRPSRPTCG